VVIDEEIMRRRARLRPYLPNLYKIPRCAHTCFTFSGFNFDESKSRSHMKIHIAFALAALSASTLVAQPSPNGEQPPPPPPPGEHRPPPPVIAVIDANHDGVISADEIANASEALKQLDKNQDGQLTRDEMRPPPPPDGGKGPQDSDSSSKSGKADE
jgi:hypothetical protein